MTANADEHDPSEQFKWLLSLSWQVPAGASAVLLLYALSFAPALARVVSVFAVGLLVAASALVAGAFFGFLFGIPRALQSASPPGAKESGSYAVNTNLEQISDWLTKIIVGVGLVELGTIARLAGDFIRNLQVGFGNAAVSPYVAGGTLTFFGVWGFLIGYLLTRTYLTSAFRAFDIGKVASQAAIDAVNRSSDQDAHALRLVSLQLNNDTQTVSAEDLRAAIKSSSAATQEQIIAQVRTQRQNTWHWASQVMGSDARERMIRQHARALTVLEAIAQVRPDDANARGELGYALKDDASPDLDRARAELGAALELARNADRKGSWFQFNLAVVQLRRDEATDEVIANLREAHEIGSTRLKSVITSDQEVRAWLGAHGLAVP